MIIVTRPGEQAEAAGETTTSGPLTQALSWRWDAPWLGESWDLTDRSSPVVKLSGALGTGQADPQHYWGTTSAIDGSTWDGARVNAGQIFLPIMVHAVDTAAFLVEHDRFIASLNPLQVGRITVTRPDGTTRSIDCRYTSGADAAMQLDPVMRCLATYGITWTTPDPYWSGAPIVMEYPYELPGGPFFPGPPFELSSTNTTNSAEVTNPGDVDSHATWRVYGPCTGFTVGIGDSLVSVVRSITAGHWIEVDLHPLRLTVVDDTGTDRWANVTQFARAPIPPGTTQLTTDLDGASAGASVRLSLTPRYRRAW
jgi:hypothetical protein